MSLFATGSKPLGIEKWAEMYLDPKKLTAISLLGVYTPEQLDEIGRNLVASSDEDRAKFWESLLDYLASENWMDAAVQDYLDGMTPEEMKQEFDEIMKVGSVDFRRELSVKVAAAYTGATTSFYNSLSMMAYGTPITRLVERAAQGDIQAYYKAYHVDQTVADVPCFAALHEQKKQELKGDFFNALSLRRRTPLIPARMKYPKLWFAFGYLDSLGVLPSKEPGGFTLDELLDLCVDMKIYGASYDKGVDDLSKRLRDYRVMQRKLMARKSTK